MGIEKSVKDASIVAFKEYLNMHVEVTLQLDFFIDPLFTLARDEVEQPMKERRGFAVKHETMIISVQESCC